MPFRRFSTGVLAGLNEDLNPHSLRDNELVVASNTARIGKAVGTRPGTLRPGSGEDYENQLPEVAASKVPVQGMFEYRKDFDIGRRLIVVAEGSGTSDSGARSGDEDNPVAVIEAHRLARSTSHPKSGSVGRVVIISGCH